MRRISRPSRSKMLPIGSRNDAAGSVCASAGLVCIAASCRGRAPEHSRDPRPEMAHGIESAEQAAKRYLEEIAPRSGIDVSKNDMHEASSCPRRLPQVVFLH